jgi:DNA-binding response OmpR family regulator
VTRNGPTLLILEDSQKSQHILQTMFADCGFKTVGARSTAEAHSIIARPDEFDVLILDMDLNEEKTGAQFGIEVRDRLQESSPEFLIQSKFQSIDYYDLALKLGAAVYLDRNEPNEPTKLVQYTRALALRHGLRPTRPGMVKELRRISSESRDKDEANTRLCRDLLVPQLSRTVGCGFVLLLSDDDGTRAFWNATDEPQQDEIYGVLQDGIFGNLKDRDPQLLDTAANSPLGTLNARQNYIRSDQPRVPFLRLAEVEGVRLSLGLFDETVPSSRLPENSLELAQILGRYMRPAVINHLVEISQAFSDLESQKRGIAEASSNFCFYVGREILNLVGNVQQESSNGDSSNALLPLRALAEELKESGELLNALATPADSGMPADDGELFDTHALIRAAWDDLSARGQIDSSFQFEISGDGAAVRRPDLFQAACYRILLWLTRRAVEYPPGTAPGIVVYIDRTPSVSIRFEDGSVRLERPFRKRLFEPYAAPYLEPVTSSKDKGRRLGLFLARAIVEAQKGTLEDQSDELPGEEIGHRLVVNLPYAR